MTRRPTDPGAIGVGVDVGGTTTRVVVFGGDDRPLHVAVEPTRRGPAALVDQLVRLVDDVVDRCGTRPAAVGVGVPGTVLGGVVELGLNVEIGRPFDLAGALRGRLGVPVAVENDVDAAALGTWSLDDEDVGSLTFLGVGTGFAAGTVVDGRLVRGRTGAAGEIGHLPVPGRTDPCPCGQVGCIELVASGRATTARMRAAGLDGGVVELWDRADGGHHGSAAIRADLVAALAWSAQLAGTYLDVDRIVLGGGVAAALGDRLTDSVRAVLDEVASRSELVRRLALADRLRTVPLGTEVGALGAWHVAAGLASVERA